MVIVVWDSRSHWSTVLWGKQNQLKPGLTPLAETRRAWNINQ